MVVTTRMCVFEFVLTRWARGRRPAEPQRCVTDRIERLQVFQHFAIVDRSHHSGGLGLDRG